MKKITLSKNAGFCFGVQRAVEEAIKIKNELNKKIYTLGPLIHNKDVVNYLEKNNIYEIEYNSIDSLEPNDTIVIRSHGVGKDIFDALKDKKLNIVNATCPYVTNIQKKVDKYSKLGYRIIILGDKNHPEVIGINGWCNNSAIITSDGNFEVELPKKVCVVSQTTEKIANWKKTIMHLSIYCKEILAFNTICSATEVRQKSVSELSKEVDLMIVIGGKNSSNTTKLYELASLNCSNTIHIENAKELQDNIFINSYINNIGITAGASTPDWIINDVMLKLEENND